MIGNVSLLFYSDFHRETGPSHSGSPTPYQECGLCAREPEMFDAVSPTKSSSDPYTTGYRRSASVCQKIENAVLPCCQSTAVEGTAGQIQCQSFLYSGGSFLKMLPWENSIVLPNSLSQASCGFFRKTVYLMSFPTKIERGPCSVLFLYFFIFHLVGKFLFIRTGSCHSAYSKLPY